MSQNKRFKHGKDYRAPFPNATRDQVPKPTVSAAPAPRPTREEQLLTLDLGGMADGLKIGSRATK